MKLFFATDVHGSEICWKKFMHRLVKCQLDAVYAGELRAGCRHLHRL